MSSAHPSLFQILELSLPPTTSASSSSSSSSLLLFLQVWILGVVWRRGQIACFSQRQFGDWGHPSDCVLLNTYTFTEDVIAYNCIFPGFSQMLKEVVI
jgi:hypothetical protein